MSEMRPAAIDVGRTEWFSRRFRGLPVQPTPLIGREVELATTRAHLVKSGTRLLTLTGPAGTGKTRLAIAVAGEVLDTFGEGVVFVDLAPLRDPGLVLAAIARVLGMPENAAQPLIAGLLHVLRHQEILLVLDNVEHLLPVAAGLGEILAHCPRVKLLVTSRIPLGLRWERELDVPPLPLPPLEGETVAAEGGQCDTSSVVATGSFACEFETIEPGGAVTATIGVTFSTSLASGTVLTGTAEIFPGTNDPNL